MDMEPSEVRLVSITAPNASSLYYRIKSETHLLDLLPHFSSRSIWPAPQMHHLRKLRPSMATAITLTYGGQNSEPSRMRPTSLKPAW